MQTVDPRIIEHVGPVSALRAEPEIVDVGSRTVLEDADQLVFRAVETPLAGIALVPNQQGLPSGVERPSGSQQLGEVPPIDEEIMDRPVLAEDDGVADEGPEERSEGGLGHLARGHLKFSVAQLAPAHRMPGYRHIVRRVGNHRLG